MIYRVYGRAIDSGLPLPEALEADGPSDLRVRLREAPPIVEGEWSDVWARRDGAPWVRLRRNGREYCIRFVDQVDFVYSISDRTIGVAVHDCDAVALRHFLVDQVLPLVLSLETLVLHACAVVVDDAAIAFAGPGGSGKSAMAALLERSGLAILSDDALVVRECGPRAIALPSYPGLRLWPELASVIAPGSPADRKARVSSGLRFDARQLPISHLFLIDDVSSNDIRFEPMTARDAAVGVLRHAYRLEQRDPAALSAEMDRACRASSALRAFRMRYPRRRERWAAVADAVVAHVRAGAHAPCCN